MISFSVCIVLLVLGYVLYGRYVERVFGMQPDRQTPAYAFEDGVDYVPLPGWRVFMIQFLNIAGLGPVFGAIMGAKFGAAAYVWIVVGSIFAGAVHDYLSGMLSLRHGGMSYAELVGLYMGRFFMLLARVFSPLMMIVVGAVFVAGPAGLMAGLTGSLFPATAGSQPVFAGYGASSLVFFFWSAVIFVYYVLATLLPIDRIVARIYPLFAAALIFMAAGVFVCLYIHLPPIPEITDGLVNTHPDARIMPLFPMLFITIACGALSGFHATQSPLMARCLKNERQGRPVFYGAMIAEGVMALIWAAAANYAFHTPEGRALVFETNAAVVVDFITRNWLGTLGAALAVLGVVAAPVTTGDTAFRAARLMVTDALGMEQRSLGKRLAVSVPLFAAGFVLLFIEFSVIWRYFAWFNQTLGALTLWMLTVYLAGEGKNYRIVLVPACFMTAVVFAYVFAAPEALGLSPLFSNLLAMAVTAACLAAFFAWKQKRAKTA